MLPRIGHTSQSGSKIKFQTPHGSPDEAQQPRPRRAQQAVPAQALRQAGSALSQSSSPLFLERRSVKWGSVGPGGCHCCVNVTLCMSNPITYPWPANQPKSQPARANQPEPASQPISHAASQPSNAAQRPTHQTTTNKHRVSLVYEWSEHELISCDAGQPRTGPRITPNKKHTSSTLKGTVFYTISSKIRFQKNLVFS